MKLHGNARTCPNSRRLLAEQVIEEGWSVAAAAAAAGISERTVYRWLARFRREGSTAFAIDPPARVALPNDYRRRRSTLSAVCASCG